MYNPLDDTAYPNFSTANNPRLLGGSDPFMMFTPTQATNIFRNFVTSPLALPFETEQARTGITPNVTLENINNPASWSRSAFENQDIDMFHRLNLLSGGASNSGLLASDVDSFAYKRMLLMGGGNPYIELQPQWQASANMTPYELLSSDQKLNRESKLKEPDGIDPETKQKFWMLTDGKKSFVGPSSEQIVLKSKALEAYAKDYLNRGTFDRIASAGEAEGSLPLRLMGWAGNSAQWAEDKFRQGVLGQTPIADKTRELYGKEASVAHYNVPGIYFSDGGMDDVAKWIKTKTADELENGFDPHQWWVTHINPEVIGNLAAKGITEDSIIGTQGSREALAKIQFSLAGTTINERIEKYTQENSWFKTSTASKLIYSLPTMLLNDPDLAFTLGAGVALNTSAKAGSLLWKGIRIAGKEYEIVSALKATIKAEQRLGTFAKGGRIASGLFSLASGDLPIWFKEYSFLARTGISSGIFGVVSAGQNVRDQLNRISFASSVLYNDTENEFSKSEVAWSGLFGGLFGGALAGIHNIRTEIKGITAKGRSALLKELETNTSLVGALPRHTEALAQGLEAAKEQVTTVGMDEPKDNLAATNENIKDGGVDVIDTSGKTMRVREEDIIPINELPPEQAIAGTHRQVRDTRTNEDVYIRKDAAEVASVKEGPKIVSEEAPLEHGEKHVAETERVADNLHMTAKSSEADGLARSTESTAMERASGESDKEFATRSINAGNVNSIMDLFRLITPTGLVANNRLSRIINVKRSIAAIREILLSVETNKSPEWIKEQLDSLDKFEKSVVDMNIAAIVSNNSAKFSKLKLADRQAIFNFVKEHTGKSPEELEVLITMDDSLNAYAKNLLRDRLIKAKDMGPIKPQLKTLLDSKQISNSAAEVMSVFLGEPTGLNLINKVKSIKSHRKEKYFLQVSSNTTKQFYLDMSASIKKNLIDNGISLDKLEPLLSVLRASLINLNLPTSKSDVLFNMVTDSKSLGSASITIDPNTGKTLLNINLSQKTLHDAILNDNTQALVHTVLHEVGHLYAYLATPDQLITMIRSYNELIDPNILMYFNQISHHKGTNTLYSICNPGEFFANVFANQATAYGLVASDSLKSTLGMSIIKYMDGIVQTISDSFTNLNAPAAVKISKINSKLKSIIKEIEQTSSKSTFNFVNIALANSSISTILDNESGTLLKDWNTKQPIKVHQQNLLSRVIKSATKLSKDDQSGGMSLGIDKLEELLQASKKEGFSGDIILGKELSKYFSSKQLTSIFKDIYGEGTTKPYPMKKTVGNVFDKVLDEVEKLINKSQKPKEPNTIQINLVDDSNAGLAAFNILLNPRNTNAVLSSNIVNASLHHLSTLVNVINEAELLSTNINLLRSFDRDTQIKILNGSSYFPIKNSELLAQEFLDKDTKVNKISGNLIVNSSNFFFNDEVVKRNVQTFQIFQESFSKKEAVTSNIVRKNIYKLERTRWNNNGELTTNLSAVISRPSMDTGSSTSSRYVYHVGTWDGGTIPTLMHTGTLLAALDRYPNKFSYLNYPDLNIHMFEITNDVNVLRMKDLGSHSNIEVYINGLRKQSEIDGTTIQTVFKELLSSNKKANEVLQKFEALKNTDRTDFENFSAALKSSGIDLIEYRNIGEDRGSTSYVIINPEKMKHKAVRVITDFPTDWKDPVSGDTLPTHTRDEYIPNYRGLSGLVNDIKLLDFNKKFELAPDFSESMNINEPDLVLTPTSILEILPEDPKNIEKLEAELTSRYMELENVKGFKKRLGGSVRSATRGYVKSGADALVTMYDISISNIRGISPRTGKKVPQQIPNILKVKSINEAIRLITGINVNTWKEELRQQSLGGKIVSDVVNDDGASLLEVGDADRNNTNLELTDNLHARRDNFIRHVNNNEVYSPEQRILILATQNLRLAEAAETIRLINSTDPIEKERGLARKKDRGDSPIKNLPQNSGERLWRLSEPEKTEEIDRLKASLDPADQALFKKKTRNLRDAAVKLEKKALAEYNKAIEKLTPELEEVSNKVSDAILSQPETVPTVLKTKQENIDADAKQSVEVQTMLDAKESIPEIAAPVKTKDSKLKTFISSSWDGTMESFRLGLVFTSEAKSAGARKFNNASHTVQATINKTNVLRVVRKTKTLLHDITNISESLLKLSNIDKQKMLPIIKAVSEGHSPEEGLRVLLKSLDSNGITAVELVDLRGNVIGYVPTADRHVVVEQILKHDDTKADGDPIGYVEPTPTKEPTKVEAVKEVKEKVEETLVAPTDPVIDPAVLPTRIVEGEPVDTGAPIVERESDIPVIPEAEKFIHEVMNAKESLRYNGLTPKIIKIALLKFSKVAKELRENIGESLTGIPDEFKKMLYIIHRAADMIAERNRELFGDNYETINNEFWTIYDREVAKDILNRGTPEEGIPFKTITDIIRYATEKVNENITMRNLRDGTSLPVFLQPLSPSDFTITSSKLTNKFPDKLVFTRGSLAEEMHYKAEKNLKGIEKKPAKVETVETSDVEISKAVLEAVNNSTHDNTMLLRESSWIGWLFGGSQRVARNWWRRSTNNVTNLLNYGSAYGSTTLSLSNIVRTVAAFADVSKTHLHHLVASKKNGIKSWEACMHEVYRMTADIKTSSLDLIKSSNEKVYAEVSKEIMQTLLTGKTLSKANIEAIIRGIVPSPSAEFLKTVTDNSFTLYSSIVEMNKRILNLENETGWMDLKDIKGKPIKPTEYFPITFVGERVTDKNFNDVVGAMVAARRKSLLASDTLDPTIILSMGWLFNKGGKILQKGRELHGRLQHYVDDANFDKQTLVNLEERRYPSGTDTKSVIELGGQASKKHFTYIDKVTNELVVCRIPTLISDLGSIDLAKYYETVNGSVDHLGKLWLASEYGSRNPLGVMMVDLLNSKVYRGDYSPYRGPRNSNPLKPMLMLNDSDGGKYGTAIPSLTKEELLSSPILMEITRSDPLETYHNFTKARGFELLVQKEIDRMIGKKGIRIYQFMNILREQAIKDATELNGEEGISHVVSGFDRLSEEYLSYQGRLGAIKSSYHKGFQELTSVGLNLVKAISGPAWGILTSAELMKHLFSSPFTVGPTQAIKNLWETARFLVGDKRFSIDSIYKDDLRESVFFIDMMRTDLEQGILTTPVDGIPRVGTWMDRVKASREDRSGRWLFISSTAEVLGNVGVEIGSSRYVTALARKFGMQRYATSFAKYINSGAALQLFEKLNDPILKKNLKDLELRAATDPKAALQLQRAFKELARVNRFGGDWHIAMAMNKYGLNTPEKINALKKAFDRLGPQYSKHNLVNWSELREVFHENSSKDILAGVLGQDGMDAFESLIFASETMTTTNGMISNPRALNREVGIGTRTPLGRISRSLLGWSQSFYNNVLGNYGGINESAYLGSLIMYTGLTAVSDLFKEWLNGRDASDIQRELSEHPAKMLFRMLHNIPVAGAFTGNLQTMLDKMSELTTGIKSPNRNASWFPAIDMVKSTVGDVIPSMYKLATEHIPNGDVPNMAKDIGTLGFNNYMNNSPLAIPARFLQEMGVINETQAFDKYLKLIKRKRNIMGPKLLNTNYEPIKVDQTRTNELKAELRRRLK